MSSSSESDISFYDSMAPSHNSTFITPANKTRKNTQNQPKNQRKKTTAQNSQNQRQTATTSRVNDDMICICFPASQDMKSNMQTNNMNGCNCTCDSGMDIGRDTAFNNDMMNMMEQEEISMNLRTNNRSRRTQRTSLAELEETAYSMPNDFEESILEIKDDPANAESLGRFYRVNSFR